MSAAQNLALIRCLPHVFSVLIENDEVCFPYIDLLLTLQEIFDLVFAPKFTDSLLSYFDSLISAFILKFKTCYPQINIKRKMHFLIHYPSVIKKWTLKTFLVHEF